jgi:hypothetical protein
MATGTSVFISDIRYCKAVQLIKGQGSPEKVVISCVFMCKLRAIGCVLSYISYRI